jgi:hypothetical protein
MPNLSFLGGSRFSLGVHVLVSDGGGNDDNMLGRWDTVSIQRVRSPPMKTSISYVRLGSEIDRNRSCHVHMPCPR